MNTEFADYIKSAAELVPPECPIVLDIIGDGLSKEEKKTVEEVVRDECAYHLGMVEKEENRHTRTFAFMLIGLIISGILLWLTRTLEDETRELFFYPVLVYGRHTVRLYLPDRI